MEQDELAAFKGKTVEEIRDMKPDQKAIGHANGWLWEYSMVSDTGFSTALASSYMELAKRNFDILKPAHWAALKSGVKEYLDRKDLPESDRLALAARGVCMKISPLARAEEHATNHATRHVTEGGKGHCYNADAYLAAREVLSHANKPENRGKADPDSLSQLQTRCDVLQAAGFADNIDAWRARDAEAWARWDAGEIDHHQRDAETNTPLGWALGPDHNDYATPEFEQWAGGRTFDAFGGSEQKQGESRTFDAFGSAAEGQGIKGPGRGM